jgi:hypothetical protein
MAWSYQLEGMKALAHIQGRAQRPIVEASLIRACTSPGPVAKSLSTRSLSRWCTASTSDLRRVRVPAAQASPKW